MKRKRQSNVCEICGYKCVRRDHITQHMRIHSDQRLFLCPVEGCVLDYKRKDHLLRHVKAKHEAHFESNNVGEQPNVCLTSFDFSGTARLAPQAEFSTKVAGPKSRGSELDITILELRQENVRLREKLAKIESETQAAIEAKIVAEKLLASLSEQHAKDQEIEAAYQRDLIADIGKCRGAIKKYAVQLECLSKRAQSLEMANSSAMEMRTKLEELKRTEFDLQGRLEEAKHQLIEGEKLRKKMLKTILDLKGNIRVFCRVRPLVPDDGVGADASVIAYPSSLEFQGRGIDLIQKGRKHSFTFDQVFSHEASQEDVFVEISELVQSAMDGYKVCIFSYGQTGSGKTYTMVGNSEALEQKGLIPRSMEQIFQTSQPLLAQGWKYKMEASMLEIHNETIHDLLSTSTKMGVQEKPCEIKEDENGNIFVSNLNVIDVGSVSEVSSLLRRAAQSRSVGKTLMNEKSSRSHFVSALHISGVNEATKQQVHGVLNLIDLAGSGRLQKTRATGDLLKETQAINKSLSSLGDVIFSLAKNRRHVPFRNSKLTHLLKPCLGGDSKTLMFVNISADYASVDETLCSLRFAERVNACKTGVPKRGTK